MDCLGHVVCTTKAPGVEDSLGQRLNTLATHIHNGGKGLLKLSDPSPEVCECVFEKHAEISWRPALRHSKCRIFQSPDVTFCRQPPLAALSVRRHVSIIAPCALRGKDRPLEAGEWKC